LSAFSIAALYVACKSSALAPHLQTSLPFRVFSAFGAQGSGGGVPAVVPPVVPSVPPVVPVVPAAVVAREPSENANVAKSTGVMPLLGSSHGPSTVVLIIVLDDMKATSWPSRFLPARRLLAAYAKTPMTKRPDVIARIFGTLWSIKRGVENISSVRIFDDTR